MIFGKKRRSSNHPIEAARYMLDHFNCRQDSKTDPIRLCRSLGFDCWEMHTAPGVRSGICKEGEQPEVTVVMAKNLTTPTKRLYVAYAIGYWLWHRHDSPYYWVCYYTGPDPATLEGQYIELLASELIAPERDIAKMIVILTKAGVAEWLWPSLMATEFNVPLGFMQERLKWNSEQVLQEHEKSGTFL